MLPQQVGELQVQVMAGPEHYSGLWVLLQASAQVGGAMGMGTVGRGPV